MSLTNSQLICRYAIDFVVDSASPKSIVSLRMFSFQINRLSADGHPLQQAGRINLILRFHEFPNKQLVLAHMHNPILGLKVLKKYQVVIDTYELKVNFANTVLTAKQLSN